MNTPLDLMDFLRIANMDAADLEQAISRLAEMNAVLEAAMRRSDDVLDRSAIRAHINRLEQLLFVARSWQDWTR